MKIVRIKDGRYDEYENLLLERDRYRKEAEFYLKAYIREFGDKTAEIFKVKIACIEKKKMIGFIQIYINRGESVNLNMMNEYIAKEMADYQKQLEIMIENNQLCRQMKTVPQDEILKIKKIYRETAKKLHPDINPLTEENEQLKELWNRLVTAYRCNDLKEIEEVQILVNTALNSLGEGNIEINIPDIEEKITALKAEIEEIRTTNPYRYKHILEDNSLIKEKNRELDEELQEYIKYESELAEYLKQYIAEGGTFSWTN